MDKFFDWEVRDGKVISDTVEDKPDPGEFEKRPFDSKQDLTNVHIQALSVPMSFLAAA